MKSNWFRKVLKEEIVEINDTVPGTIEKLRSLNQFSEELDCNDEQLQFYCNKKGTFSITQYMYYRGRRAPQHLDREFYISGKVFSENGKTYIKYQQVQNKIIGFAFILGIVYEIALLGILIALNEIYEMYDVRVWLLALVFVPIIIAGITRIKRQKEFKDVDFYKMEKEMQRRIEAVKRWND